MVDTRKKCSTGPRPAFVATLVPLLTLLLGLWALTLSYDRNPLTFQHRDYRVFSTNSADIQGAMEKVMQSLRQRLRFRADATNSERALVAGSTIIN